MDPNNPYQQPAQQPTYSIDYLNEISASAPQKAPWPKWAVIAGIAAFLVTLLIGGLLIINSQPSSVDKSQSYYLRLSNLKTLATNQQKYLRNPTTRNRNSTLTLLLTAADSKASELFASQSIEVRPEKIAKAKVKAVEDAYIAKLTSEIDDYRLNATLDQAYPREMAYQLNLLLNQLSTLKKISKSNALNQYADATIKDLQPIIKTLEES